MLVKNWMNKNVITIKSDDAMSDAMRLLKEHDIRLLPVMNKGKLVGVVTDRDLKRASASDATSLEVHELLYLLSRIKIKEIMNACFSCMRFPEKLPRPTYRSQNESVIPISSSFPEKVARRRRRTVICRSKEEKPMATNGKNLFRYIISSLFYFIYYEI